MGDTCIKIIVLDFYLFILYFIDQHEVKRIFKIVNWLDLQDIRPENSR
jgi:hypothetical protein